MSAAAQIVVSEIEVLERRVRAFSEFASEPPVNPAALDVNALVTARRIFVNAFLCVSASRRWDIANGYGS